jgi:hypothetical protein
VIIHTITFIIVYSINSLRAILTPVSRFRRKSREREHFHTDNLGKRIYMKLVILCCKITEPHKRRPRTDMGWSAIEEKEVILCGLLYDAVNM